MVSAPVVDAIAVVALVSFYGGLSRELATTADFLDVRLGLGLSLGAYVAIGVAALLSFAVVVFAVLDRHRAGEPLASILAFAVGLGVVLVLTFVLFFKLGTATYGLLLRVGLDLP